MTSDSLNPAHSAATPAVDGAPLESGNPSAAAARGAIPERAAGVEIHGPLQGSGYRVVPHLVRRGDGQVVQITPLLAAVLDAVDGRADLDEIARRAGETVGRELHADDVDLLIARKLRPLGLVRCADGIDLEVERTNPLLGLRGRVSIVNASRTNAIVRPFVWLFRPLVVVLVVVAFSGVSVWSLLHHGLGGAVDEALADPALLLVLIGLIIASAAFHEVGHAAACRFGGATPGVMGAAVYLVWPAFYTDVTDSYRLSRAGRLRVDLGGLYFNAVYTVATFAVWVATGTEALLILIPVQLLQMVRQLVPLVRFDGYHILADLVGVPDLFSRIKPTLLGVLPWRRDTASNPLRPWAQAVVVTWVLVVVPVLAVSFALLLVNLPAVMASAARSLRLQADLLGANFDAGRPAAVALGVVAMTTVAFVPLSTIYLGSRIFHRGSRRFWRATEQRPMLRAGAFAVIAALVVSAGPGLLPAPSNDPAVSDLAAPLAGFPGAELAAGARLDPGEPEPVGTADRQRPTKTTAAKEKAPRGGETTALAAQANGRQDGSVSGRPPRSGLPPRSGGADPDPDLGPGVEVTWPFSFPPPEPPDAGGNQVVVTNWANGSTAFDLETSLQWDADGVIDNENSAYALAACTACRTVATAFQIVAATTPTSTVVPRNLAVAANENCNACVTRAVAVQLVVTLDAMPDPAAKREIERLVASIQAREAAYTAMDPARVRAELVAAKARALEILAPWLDETEEAPEPELETGETAATDQSESSEPETGETEAASDAPQEQPTTAGGAESSDSETDTPAVEEPAPTAPGDSPPPSDSGSDTTATTPSDDSGTTSSTTEPPAGTPSEEDPTAGQ